MSNTDSPPALPDGYKSLSGPFPLLSYDNLWWLDLVETLSSGGAAMEAGLYLYSGQDTARVFWYPEEALAAMALLQDLESQLKVLLSKQGYRSQEESNA